MTKPKTAVEAQSQSHAAEEQTENAADAPSGVPRASLPEPRVIPWREETRPVRMEDIASIVTAGAAFVGALHVCGDNGMHMHKEAVSSIAASVLRLMARAEQLATPPVAQE
ncbi:hypothetical protein JGU66_18690 [Myxococcaceae bacterium JPH2]|nr:hypothetical protein [Myxococcaceae bacterium JPH2]